MGFLGQSEIHWLVAHWHFIPQSFLSVRRGKLSSFCVCMLPICHYLPAAPSAFEAHCWVLLLHSALPSKGTFLLLSLQTELR